MAGCRGFELPMAATGITSLVLCTSETSSNVNVSMHVNTGCAIGACCGHSDWTMRLQRYENNQWNTIGTRTGYVCSDDPSHRTFTNVLKKNKPMRVLVYLNFPNQTISSYQWVR